MTNGTALLVDDEADLLDALAFAIRHIGFRVFAAQNIAAALELSRAHRPDVVVTDVRMPGGSGPELFDRMQAMFAAPPPFVLSTGFADVKPEDVYDRGIEAILIKPFELAELQATVRRVTTPLVERWSARPTPGPARALRLGPAELAFGRGGLFAALAEPPRAGERVHLRIDLPDAEVAAAGIVRWSRTHADPGCGIELVSVADAPALHSRLTALGPSAYIPSSARKGSRTPTPFGTRS